MPDDLLAGGLRFHRNDRLRKAKDFQRVNRTGRRRAGTHFVVVTAPGRNSRGRRLGLAVSRRVGSAVRRNRVKRRVREWFRHDRVVLPTGTDLVVIARQGAAGLDARATWRELRELLR